MGIFSIDDEVKAIRIKLDESLVKIDQLTDNLNGAVTEIRALVAMTATSKIVVQLDGRKVAESIQPRTGDPNHGKGITQDGSTPERMR